MKVLPAEPELLAIAERVVWFETPQRALADSLRFMAYLMTYGTAEEVVTVLRYLAPEDVREAVETRPPGVFDDRSWAYWNVMVGRYPVPPMPSRTLREL